MHNTATVTLTQDQLIALIEGLNERDTRLISQRYNAGPAGIIKIDKMLSKSDALAQLLRDALIKI